jgi:ABC-type phosphate transport system permease subunit
MVCPSSIYGFWLTLWLLELFRQHLNSLSQMTKQSHQSCYSCCKQVMNEERTRLWLRQTEHMHGYLCHKYFVTVNQVLLINSLASWTFQTTPKQFKPNDKTVSDHNSIDTTSDKYFIHVQHENKLISYNFTTLCP